MGRIGLVTSSTYEFDLYVCFIAFMIRFTDFMLFFSPYIGWSHDTFQTLEHGHDCCSSILHIWVWPIFCLLWYASLSFWYFSVSIYIILGIYLQMGSVFFPPPMHSSIYQYFCIIGLMIGFTDFIFLSSYMVQTDGSWDTLIYGQQHLSSPCMWDLTCILCFTDLNCSTPQLCESR